MESRRRTFVKGITFRVLATLATFVVVFSFTGNLGLAGAVGGIDAISKFTLYYFHERAWNKSSWGTQ
ncbi:MAG: DUF2061 domain-containing protein [Nanoarchaeota archaeon]